MLLGVIHLGGKSLWQLNKGEIGGKWAVLGSGWKAHGSICAWLYIWKSFGQHPILSSFTQQIFSPCFPSHRSIKCHTAWGLETKLATPLKIFHCQLFDNLSNSSTTELSRNTPSFNSNRYNRNCAQDHSRSFKIIQDLEWSHHYSDLKSLTRPMQDLPRSCQGCHLSCT